MKKRKTIPINKIDGYITIGKEYDIKGFEYETDGEIFVYRKKDSNSSNEEGDE